MCNRCSSIVRSLCDSALLLNCTASRQCPLIDPHSSLYTLCMLCYYMHVLLCTTQCSLTMETGINCLATFRPLLFCSIHSTFCSALKWDSFDRCEIPRFSNWLNLQSLGIAFTSLQNTCFVLSHLKVCELVSSAQLISEGDFQLSFYKTSFFRKPACFGERPCRASENQGKELKASGRKLSNLETPFPAQSHLQVI